MEFFDELFKEDCAQCFYDSLNYVREANLNGGI
jgi:hypothetical protein